ncbi:MAG TPA: hypothetical protein VLI41_14665 [Phenylobacterium sp.]|uniref:hypothetical protein n=1 Tax=Phenylobacterium sp. TaxID=1871053 RepID=UPI002B93CB2F|nr:hypothetical protein [Phenylobacterium sp.]HSV04435.1 hypothetical protein [Phenylobacterium sp.]
MQIDRPPAECAQLIAQTAAWPDEKDKEAVRRWSDLYKRKFECVRLTEAGWSPIEKAAEQGREVRRATFQDGRLAFRIPAVALERTRDGAVWIRLSINRPARVFSARLPPESWTRLTAHDEDARRPVAARTWEGPGLPPLGCHGWSVTVEGAEAKRSWRQDLSECTADPDSPAFAYAYELASIAIDHISECAAAKAKAESQGHGPQEPVRGLIYCAGRFAPRTFENP